jgi:hypothetical protein
MPKFVTQYNRKGLEKPIDFNPVDNVARQYTDLCDLNNIMDNYNDNKVLPFKKDLSYSETGVNVADFQSSFDVIESVKNEFQQLPSSVRKEFGNDLFRYVQHISDAYAGNRESINFLSNLGLLTGSKSLESAELSQSGDSFSVHSSPDDSKNSEQGS